MRLSAPVLILLWFNPTRDKLFWGSSCVHVGRLVGSESRVVAPRSKETPDGPKRETCQGQGIWKSTFGCELKNSLGTKGSWVG